MIDVQNASENNAVPDENHFRQWVTTCLEGFRDSAELTIRVVDEPEIREMNRRWRDTDKATNVLSFPAGDIEVAPELLGDIIICAPVIRREAEEQAKSNDAHWAHMTIHGTLHLLGYDHMNDDEAEEMESIETDKLGILGYPDPYI